MPSLFPYTDIASVRAATGMTNIANIADATITLKINAAAAIVNGKIGSAYQVPLTVACALITTLTTEMAAALLYLDQFGEESQNTDKGWQKRWDAYLKLLEDIRQLRTRLFSDADGTELVRADTRKLQFYPNNASSDPSAPDTTKPKIKMDQIF